MEEQESEYLLSDKLKKYINTRLNIAYLTAVDKGSTMMAASMSKLILGSFFAMFFLFGSLAVAYYLSELFRSFFYGFGTVALFYLVIGLLVYLVRKPLIEKPLTNSFVKHLCKDLDLEEDGK